MAWYIAVPSYRTQRYSRQARGNNASAALTALADNLTLSSIRSYTRPRDATQWGLAILSAPLNCGSCRSLARHCADIIQMGSFPRPAVCRSVNDQPVREALGACAHRSPVWDLSPPIAISPAPPEPHLRDPRLDTPATSARADLMEDFVGLRRPLYGPLSRD